MTDRQRDLLRTATVGIAAGLTGAALALIFAPQSGKRTRRRIKRWGGDLVARVEDFQEDIAERLDDLVEDFEEVRARGLEKGKNLSVQVRSELLRPLQASKELMSRQLERAERLFDD